MEIRGIVLIAFSAACLGVAGLAHQESGRSGLTATLDTSNGVKCSSGSGGFETAAGRVSCLQQVSYGLIKDGIGNAKAYFGGDAFNPN